MRLLIQRVTEGSVTIDGTVSGSIKKGFVVFIGIENDDTTVIVEKMVRKLLGLRIFEDENGKTNLSLKDVHGQLLLISQFTLYADCQHGNRPSFINAGAPDHANRLYEYMISLCQREYGPVATGQFGADMKVALVNDGPFTIWLDSQDIMKAST
ncbi:MAG: D-aminoacyl-tRNA deacylase [Lachnospiraceae bacterium]|nr:D-aminoacyl-tRNA deacylase [Lachnospiraceae bacterium]